MRRSTQEFAFSLSAAVFCHVLVISQTKLFLECQREENRTEHIGVVVCSRPPSCHFCLHLARPDNDLPLSCFLTSLQLDLQEGQLALTTLVDIVSGQARAVDHLEHALMHISGDVEEQKELYHALSGCIQEQKEELQKAMKQYDEKLANQHALISKQQAVLSVR